jgi:peptidoglycan L-alanyl-D-glutamate endopeptidase CwlK
VPGGALSNPNPYVLELQGLLNQHGAKLDRDGGYGRLTHIATLEALGLQVAEPLPKVVASKWADTQPKLKGVHPRLQAVVQRLQETGVPFVLLEGMRTPERQAKLVASGASETLNSRHLTGHAVDLAPMLPNGKPSWDWEDYYPFAEVVRRCVMAERVAVNWGGVFDRDVRELVNLREAVALYVKRRKAAAPNKSVFLDGPHWQLTRTEFPA